MYAPVIDLMTILAEQFANSDIPNTWRVTVPAAGPGNVTSPAVPGHPTGVQLSSGGCLHHHHALVLRHGVGFLQVL